LNVFHINNPTLRVNNIQTFEITINEKSWQIVDQDEPRVAKKKELLQVLVQIEAILIRASFSSKMKETLLKDVSLTIAVPKKTGSNIAVNVEQCLCPRGYFGLSCEQCAYGYIKETNTSKPFKCIFCECNSHSEACDTKTGQCLVSLFQTLKSNLTHTFYYYLHRNAVITPLEIIANSVPKDFLVTLNGVVQIVVNRVLVL